MHLLRKLLLLLCIALLEFANVYADSSGKAGDDIRWHLDNSGLLTFSGSGKMKDFGRSLPFRPDLVKSVTIETGITSIGNNAFNGCTKLIKVSLPSSLEDIGCGAFAGCSSLPFINIPYGVKKIGKDAFKGCNQISEINLPGSLLTIESEAFANCKSLVIIRVPSSLKTLGAKAFQNSNLIDVINELPEFVTPATAKFYSLSVDKVAKYYNKSSQPYQNIANVNPTPSISNVQVKKVDSPQAFIPDMIDINVPFTKRKNDKTYVVIISNENYSKMERVPYAVNDGEIFRQYCEYTLGVPASNIIIHSDATSGIMRGALADLQTANRVVGSEMKVIFYYSGHGAPDDATLESYLVPVDAHRINQHVCLPLNEVYETIASLDIESAVMFIDACFSGGVRSGGTLLAANGERGITRVPKKTNIKGNIVVFSATDADQTALPYTEKGHGIFTYYLLKKLYETKGNTSLAELDAYLKEKVNQTAFSINRREQTPTLSISPKILDQWQGWKLNQ